MTDSDVVDDIFDEVDTNRDGRYASEVSVKS